MPTPHLRPGEPISERLAVQLRSARGAARFHVILFVRGPWCPVCRRQITRLAAHADELTALEATLTVVSTAPVAEFQRDEALGDLPVTFLHDPGAGTISALQIAMEHPDHGVIARPATVVLDEQGVIRFAHLGHHTRDRPEPAAIILAVRHLAMAR